MTRTLAAEYNGSLAGLIEIFRRRLHNAIDPSACLAYKMNNDRKILPLHDIIPRILREVFSLKFLDRVQRIFVLL